MLNVDYIFQYYLNHYTFLLYQLKYFFISCCMPTLNIPYIICGDKLKKVVYLCGAIGKALGYQSGGHAFVPCHRTLWYVLHCWLINPYKLNLLWWLVTYLSYTCKVHNTNIFKACSNMTSLTFYCNLLRAVT